MGRFLLGSISLILYIITTVTLAVVTIILALLLFLIPIASWRRGFQTHVLQRIPALHAAINSAIMMISTHGKWDIAGTGSLKKEGWYVMMSNHRSWMDILILYHVFKGKIPPLKFFMKKELLWQLPFAGLACYALGYPFMSRHSHADIRKNPALKGKDAETTKKACAGLRHFPTTLINFIEGTRFTQKKKDRQQSPFQHLLKPHAGGVAVVVHELENTLSGLINVVIIYPKKTPSAWDFICGNFKKIIVRYEVLPITPNMIGNYHTDRQFRAQFQQWLNEIWLKNDAMIEQAHHEH